MIVEQGFFVRYGDTLYSEAHENLNEARKDAKKYDNHKKLKIYHGKLRRHGSTIIDDSELYLVPRIGGYK